MRSPPADVLAWVELHVDTRVVGVVPMSGGIDAHMFRLSLDGRDDVVLRIARGGDWDDIEHQARLLTLLGNTDIPVPRLLAADVEVGAGRHPALLQSLLHGDVTLPAAPSQAWIESLASTILAIQAVPLQTWMPDRAERRWAQVEAEPEPDWSEDDARLLRALLPLRNRTPLTRAFVHDDYWIGNTLRSGDDVIGVVDWGHGGLGSAARDATYCAVDMSLCYGVEVGDRLLSFVRARLDLDELEWLAWTARAVLMSRYFPEWLTGWNSLGARVTYGEAAGRRAHLVDRALDLLA